MLTGRLQEVFQSLGRRGKLRESDVEGALRDIRLALLEADVNYQVVRDLLSRVRQRALGKEVSRALNPSQQVIRILHEELVEALGRPGRLDLKGPSPRTIMLVGLQGSGKTTSAAKLGLRLQSKGERVWLVAADPYRPAAFEQLKVLGEEHNLQVLGDPSLEPPLLCAQAVARAEDGGATAVIFDTAGRSQIDERMMRELQAIQARVDPNEVLLVADGMTGQEAVRIAQGFHESLGLTGLILTKMDGDARGGAAISMRSVTGVPIKFIGTGESRDALENFEPDRLASRILGMGDVMSLIERAESTYDQRQAEEQVSRLMQGEFTLEDYAQQLRQLRRMGPLSKILEMMPSGIGAFPAGVDGHLAERQVIRTQAILSSMTPYERQRPEVLNASRKRRIARGSGTSVQEINQLIRSYRGMKKLFKNLGKGGMSGLGRLLGG
jgi:signal recognition particle subunit SRP54